MSGIRDRWESLADRTLAAVRPYASSGHALIQLPGPASRSGQRSDGLEGFARTFLAAAFRIPHAPAVVREELAAWYAGGIEAGVDPTGPERWPGVNEIHQARVEAASIALGLYETRDVLWARLDGTTRQRVMDWFAPVIGQPYPACNWVWFRAVVEAFLRWAGGPWSTVDIEQTVELTEAWYVGDGWYTDGFGQAEGGSPPSDSPAARTGRPGKFDWYCGWAMHLYPLWYCRMSPPAEVAALAERYRERLRRYLAGVQHLYAPDGAPLYQGRSLTYRFATVAPLWAGALFDASPLPPGRTRRLATGVLDYFERHGAWNAAGLQSIGWHGEFPPIRQPYSGPGSPYWSSKGFAGLLLPPDHPVWTDAEQPPELAERDVALTLPGPGWLVSGTQADGVVRVVNHGSDGWGAPAATGPAESIVDDPVYTRHGYSTHAGPDYAGRPDADPDHPSPNHPDPDRADPDPTGPDLAGPDPAGPDRTGPHLTEPDHTGPRPTGPERAGWDGQVALVAPDGTVAVRRPLYLVSIVDRVAVSRFPAFGTWVTTGSVLRGAVEIRLARVATAGPWTLRIGGYCLAGPAPVPGNSTGLAGRVGAPGGIHSTVDIRRGLDRVEIVRSQGGNAFGPHAATPVAVSDAPVRAGAVYAVAVVLGGPPYTRNLPVLDVVDGLVRVRWASGETDVVDLALAPS